MYQNLSLNKKLNLLTLIIMQICFYKIILNNSIYLVWTYEIYVMFTWKNVLSDFGSSQMKYLLDSGAQPNKAPTNNRNRFERLIFRFSMQRRWDINISPNVYLNNRLRSWHYSRRIVCLAPRNDFINVLSPLSSPW